MFLPFYFVLKYTPATWQTLSWVHWKLYILIAIYIYYIFHTQHFFLSPFNKSLHYTHTHILGLIHTWPFGSVCRRTWTAAPCIAMERRMSAETCPLTSDPLKTDVWGPRPHPSMRIGSGKIWWKQTCCPFSSDRSIGTQRCPTSPSPLSEQRGACHRRLSGDLRTDLPLSRREQADSVATESAKCEWSLILQ